MTGLMSNKLTMTFAVIGSLVLFACGCASSRIHFGERSLASREFLRTHMIHEVCFREAPMSDVAIFIARNVNCIGVPPDIKQIVDANVVIYKIGLHAEEEVDSVQNYSFENPPIRTFGPIVSLSLQNVSMLCLFEEVSRQTKCSVMIEQSEIVLCVPKVSCLLRHGNANDVPVSYPPPF